jgi:hypothetical protein
MAVDVKMLRKVVKVYTHRLRALIFILYMLQWVEKKAALYHV